MNPDDDRCRGHCCQAFSLGPYSSQKSRYEESLARREEDRTAMDRENIQIFPMLVPLYLPVLNEFTSNPVHALSQLYHIGPNQHRVPEDPSMFRCSHNLPNGDCGIYESRPEMCVRYPNGGRCDYVMCGSRTLKNFGVFSWAASGGEPFVPLERLTGPSRQRPRGGVYLQDEYRLKMKRLVWGNYGIIRKTEFDEFAIATKGQE